jgi:hypothetical protein
VAEEVADLVAIVEQTGLASQANAVSSTASPMDATSLTTDQHARKRRLCTVIQQPTLTQAWERCGTRISTLDQAAYHAIPPEELGGQLITKVKLIKQQ